MTHLELRAAEHSGITVAFRSACGSGPLLGLIAGGICLACASRSPPAAIADEIRLADDAPGPLPVEQSQQLFRVPDGFRVEIVASEPHVGRPGGDGLRCTGRILVCEIHGYNLEGYLDIEELNKTGELDRQVRRDSCLG